MRCRKDLEASSCIISVWGAYDQYAPLNCKSLLLNIVSFIGLFCKRDLSFEGAY